MTLIRLLPILALLSLTVRAPAVPRTLLLVTGAPGTEEYGGIFAKQADAWRLAGESAGARVIEIGGASGETTVTDREQFYASLTSVPEGEFWMVLIGHGTWDGKNAQFNLRGPDISAVDLAAWMKPLAGPAVVIHTGSCSAPFLPALAAPGRVVISATRSGSEQNYARFGEYLAEGLTDPGADLDEDGSVSVLELFLAASARVDEFYAADGRIVTEHALIDDNGDGLGTPAGWFRGVRATKSAGDKAAVDGIRARTITLLPDTVSSELTEAALQERDAMEARIAALREGKADMAEAAYYARLEELLVELARVYGRSD